MLMQSFVLCTFSILVAWLSARRKLMFPLFWTSRVWLFLQAWIFSTVALMLFAYLGIAIALSETYQQGLAEVLAPIAATVVFLRVRMWPNPDALK